jgi:Mg2+ and Co2+ transporter CorA
MDPLSITTASITLVKLCATVGWELQKFIDDVKLSGTVINALHKDMQAFEKVLEQVKNILNNPEIDTSSSTGPMRSHWHHLKDSLSDAEKTLNALETTILRVNKNVGFLHSTRTHIRLQRATDEIALFQQQIRTYNDTFQISLQTIGLYVASDMNDFRNVQTLIPLVTGGIKFQQKRPLKWYCLLWISWKSPFVMWL